jgi:hypothetical protein
MVIFFCIAFYQGNILNTTRKHHNETPQGKELTMIEQDTIRLLRECDAGCKMGIATLREVEPYVSHKALREFLKKSQSAHEDLQGQIQEMLDEYQDGGKEPNPMAKSMSWMKTNVMLTMNESDTTIADLVTDGCNMGIKSLNRYLNQYGAASEYSKDIAKKLIHLEEELNNEIKKYL